MNLKQNILLVDFHNKEIYGFMTDYQYNELEYLIMIIYLCLHIYYQKQVKSKNYIIKTFQSQISKESKDNGSQLKQEFSINEKKENVFKSGLKSEYENNRLSQEKDEKEVTFYNVFIAVIAKYSDVFSLFILFWISLYTVNVLHLILAFFFLLFFIQLGTSISNNPTKNNKSGPKTKKSYNFVRRFWVYLIIYVNFMIFLRYFWVVFIVPYLGDDFLSYPEVIFIGITYDYNISPSIGLVDEGYLFIKIKKIMFLIRLWRNDNYMDSIHFYCFAI